MFGQHPLQEDINKLIRHYFDAKEDYRLACKRAAKELQPELTEKINKRESMHMQMQQALTVLSGEPSDNGTVAADFKRDWERLRGTVSGHAFEAALKLAEQSDASALDLAEDLLRRTMTDNLKALIQSHVEELRESQARVGQLLTTAAPAH